MMTILLILHALVHFLASDDYQIWDSITGFILVVLALVYIRLLMKRIRLLEEILQTHIVMDQTMIERLLDKKCETELKKDWKRRE